MKAKIQHLKKVLHDNREDIKYILFVGIPTFILLVLSSKCGHFGDIY
jgi:hypothetical protein